MSMLARRTLLAGAALPALAINIRPGRAKHDAAAWGILDSAAGTLT